jgi:hypothetical protein
MDRAQRALARARGSARRVTITLPDDSGPVQRHQIEGYTGEIRNDIQRLTGIGMSSVALPGAKGIVLWPGGAPGIGVLVGLDDPRHRPTGLKPGEFVLYALAGADADGSGATMRPILKGTVDGNGVLTGINISIGDGDTQSITLTAPEIILDSAVIRLGGAGANKPVAMLGSIDSHGDTETSNLATKVFAE